MKNSMCAMLALVLAFLIPSLAFAGAGPLTTDQKVELLAQTVGELEDHVDKLEGHLKAERAKRLALEERVEELESYTSWLEDVVIPSLLDSATFQATQIDGLWDWALEHDFQIFMLESWAQPLQAAGLEAGYGGDDVKPVVLLETTDGQIVNLSQMTSYVIDQVNAAQNWISQNEYKIDAAWEMYGQFYDWLAEASGRIIFSSFEVFVYASNNGAMPVALGMTQQTLSSVAGKSNQHDTAIIELQSEVGEANGWISAWGGILKPFVLYTDEFGTNHMQYNGNFVISGALVANDLDIEEVGVFGGTVSAPEFQVIPAE